MWTPRLNFPFLGIICFLLCQLAQANKLEELYHVKARLEADLRTSYTAPIAPLYWKQKELASLNLTRVATWLSTLSDRCLTLSEGTVIRDIFFQLLRMKQADLPFPKTELQKLAELTRSKELENELNRLLRTAIQPTEAFSTLDESGIWQSLLKLLPESEVSSMAQINRRWRKEVHTYYKKKGYLPVLSPDALETLKRKFKTQNPELSESVIRSMVEEYEFTGFREYYSFATSIFRFLQNSVLRPKDIRIKSLHQGLHSILSSLPSDSLLYRLTYDLTTSLHPPVYSQNLNSRVITVSQGVINQYLKLASQRHFYAIQTLSWLKELNKVLPIIVGSVPLDPLEIDAVLPDPSPLSNVFPEARHFFRWKDAREAKKLRYTHFYTYQASLLRLYKSQGNRFGHTEDWDFHFDHSTELAPSYFLNREEQVAFFSNMKVNSKNSHFGDSDDLDYYSRREANGYVALGDPQRAISLLKQGENLSKKENQDRLRMYEAVLAFKSGLTETDLLRGRDEAEQERLANDFKIIKTERFLLPEKLLRRGFYMEAYESDRFFKLTEKHYLPLSKRHLITGFYKGGVLKTIERKMKGSNDLSALDSILDLDEVWPRAYELLQNQTIQGNYQTIFSNEEICLLNLLSETKHDPDIWTNHANPSCQHDFSLLSNLKKFKEIVDLHRQIQWRIVPGLSTTQVAQAYLEEGYPEECLNFLARQERPLAPLSFADQQIKIQALQALRQDSTSAIDHQSQHEREILLPDLRQAARFYEEDGDLVRAERALSKAYQLAQKLNDPGMETDRANHQKVLDAIAWTNSETH